MLAALLKSPTDYDPADQPEHAAERARLVLDAMVETGAITPAQRAQALAQPPQGLARPAAPRRRSISSTGWTARPAPWSAQPRQDLVVETTLDLPLESAADDSATAALAALSRPGRAARRRWSPLDGGGRVRAMVGGADYGASPFDRAVAAHRQAGSCVEAVRLSDRAWRPAARRTIRWSTSR